MVLLVFLTTSILGQNFFPILGGQRAGTSIFTFLKIGVSARAEGMGEAVVVSGGVVLVTALLVILIRRVQGTSGIR